MGRHLKIMETEDLGKIIEYDPLNMRFICEAHDPVHLGELREVAAAAQKAQRKLFRGFDKLGKEAEKLKLTDVRDRIMADKELIVANTLAVTKHTPVTDMLLDANDENMHKKEKKTLTMQQNEKREEFRKSGERPQFQSVYDRFVWAIVNEQWNDKDEKLKQMGNNKIYDLAYKEAMRQKAG